MKTKFGFLIPLLLVVVYFLTIKQVIAPWVYLILALPVGLLYFPISLFPIGKWSFSVQKQSRITKLASNFLFSAIISLTIVTVYLDIIGDAMKIVLIVLALALNSFIVYSYIKEKFNYNLAIYFSFLFLLAGILAI